MKILVVDDDDFKVECLAKFLEARGVEMHLEYSVKPALRYAINNPKEISGVILDLGLTSDNNSFDYDWVRGLDFISRLAFDKIDIPILINSSTIIDLDKIKKDYRNVVGQMYEEDDYQTLGSFLDFLKSREQ